MISISSLAYSSKVNPALTLQLKVLFDGCRKNGFEFIDNMAVLEINLWTDGIHVLENGKRIVVNNFIDSLYYFLEFINSVSSYLNVKMSFRLKN